MARDNGQVLLLAGAAILATVVALGMKEKEKQKEEPSPPPPSFPGTPKPGAPGTVPSVPPTAHIGSVNILYGKG